MHSVIWPIFPPLIGILLIVWLALRNREALVIFLLMIGTFIGAFGVVMGHPIGLLASLGGWLILDTALLLSALAATVAAKALRRTAC